MLFFYCTLSQSVFNPYSLCNAFVSLHPPPDSSFPAPVIPTESRGRTFSTNYFTHDTRRNADANVNFPIENSFTGEQIKLLPRERLVDKPEMGSPGAKNPAVERYDPSGLRSAMTANWPALQKSLKAARPTQLNLPSWQRHPSPDTESIEQKLKAQSLPGAFLGVPKDSRKRGWAMATITDA